MIEVAPELLELKINSLNACFVVFSVSWCGTCALLISILDTKIVPLYKDSNIKFFNVDGTDPNIKEEYKIKYYPTCIIFINGKPTTKLVGLKKLRDGTMFNAINEYLVANGFESQELNIKVLILHDKDEYLKLLNLNTRNSNK